MLVIVDATCLSQLSMTASRGAATPTRLGPAPGRGPGLRRWIQGQHRFFSGTFGGVSAKKYLSGLPRQDRDSSPHLDSINR